MTINKFTSIFYLLLLRLDIVFLINCECDVTFTFTNMKLEVVPQNQGACITGTTYQVYFVKSTFGVFSGNDVINFKCDNEAASQIKITMDTQISYYIFKNTSPEEYMMIISDIYKTDVSISSFVYKEVYHQYDFECFHTDHTDINTHSTNFITVTQSKHFGSDTFKLKCYWFSVRVTAEKTIQYNGNSLKIQIKPKNNEDSPIMSNLVQCKKATPTTLPASITKRVTMVAQDQEIFCINPTTHFMEKVELDPEDDPFKNTKTGDITSDFCVYPSSNAQLSCFQMGKHFKYAIFSSTLSGTKSIVMKHFEADDPNTYYRGTALLGKEWDVARDSLMCVSNMNFNDKFMKTIGIYDDTPKKQCFLTSDLMWDHKAYYTHGGNNHYIQLYGCKASPVVPISTSPIIKYNSTGVACLPYGNNIVKRIVPSSLQIIYTNICPIQYTSTICYKVSDNVKYAIISHETTKTDTLIVKYDIINFEGDDDYIYDETYYMDEMVCMKKSLIKNFETVKNEPYFYHYSETIICFIVDDMNANDKIQITGSVGCDSREILVQPSTARTSTYENLKQRCADILNEGRTDRSILIESSEEILTKCLKVTCTQKIYAFSPTDFAKEKGRLIDCSVDSQGCVLIDQAKSLIYLVRNQKKNLKFYVSSTQLTLELTSIHYSPDYYNSDVVCFLEDKIVGEKQETIFQVKSTQYLCSVVKEIPSNIETINTNPTSNCPYEIKLHKYAVNPNPNSPSFDVTCSYVITESDAKIIKVSRNSVEDCIKRTCSVVNSIVELSISTNNVEYTISTCDAASNAQDACLKKVFVGGLMTVTSTNTGQKLLYTKEPVGEIPDDFYYSSFYGDEDFVCFKKSNVKNIEVIQQQNAQIESSDRLCVFVKSLSASVDLILQLELTNSCNREIKLSSSDTSAKKTAASDFSRKCNEFHLKENLNPKILDENISEIMNCITKLCIDLEYQIMINGDFKNCRSVNCNKDDTNTKYFKTTSRYNKKVHYIIPIAQQKQYIITSRVNNFYKSDFYNSDIVCYKQQNLRNEDKVVVPGYVVYDTNIICYIVKEMTENKNIELTVQEGCKRTINFHVTQFSVNQQTPSGQLDSLCEEFGKITNAQQPIIMALDTLRKCVKHFCLTPIFVTHKSSINGDHAGTRKDCAGNSHSCITEIQSYDYAKIRNSYTEQEFYVQNSENRKLTIEDDYFYPSPYFKTEVMCIKLDRVEATSLGLSYLNSYDLDGFKCIILNELNEKDEIKIDKVKRCERTISIQTPVSRQSIARTVDAIICQDLLGTNVDSTKVFKITYNILSICMTNTCSRVVSRVELATETSLIHSSIIECSSIQGGQDCIKSDIKYDFIRVESQTFQSHRYFRFFESSDLNKYTPKKIEFYVDEYHQGYVVCFKTDDVEEIDSWKSETGVFYEEPRICAIAKELQKDIEVNYKLTEKYIQPIKIKSSPSGVIPFENGDQTKQTCQTFFNNDRDPQENYVELTKAILIECVLKTRSLVYFFVDVKQEHITSAHKKLNMCNKRKDINSCLSTVAHFDALKIKSPYRETPFYVRSSGVNQLNQNLFDSFYYKTKYYSDDVICIPNNRIQDPLNPTLKRSGFLGVNEVTCVVVTDVDTQQSIQVKMLNKCDKTIYFVRYGYESDSGSNDECSAFYGGGSTQASVIKMSLTSLRTCITASCSKLNYFITEQANPDTFIKKLNDCNGDQSYGSITCIEGIKNYFMAKVERATGSDYIYVQSDNIQEIELSTYDSYYYSPMYYNDEVFCFNKNRLTLPNEPSIKRIEIGDKYLACIIIKELSQEVSVTLKTKDECNVQIILKFTQSKPVPAAAESSDSCKPLYNKLQNESPIQQMKLTDLQACILKTCTKIVSYVKRDDLNEGYKHAKNVLCETGFGINSCLSGTNYDFAIVMNSYLSKPIMFRSLDYDNLQVAASQIKSFEHSVYFKDDIVCYLSESILELQKIVSLEAVYSHNKRTCIIGSKVEKELEFTLSITNKCNRKISVLNASKSASPDSKKDKDVECSKYYDNTQTLLVQSKQKMLSCVEHTCGTVEFLNQSISKTSCENSDTICDNTLEFTYAIVKSEHLKSSVLVISEDVKSKWLELVESMNKYESIYPAGEITCFKHKIFTKKSTTVETYQNTDLDLLCVHPKSTDPEFLLTIEQGSTEKLNLLSPSDTEITSLASKKFKFIISTVIPETQTMAEVFTLEQKSESNNKQGGVDSISELETCTTNKPKKDANKDFIDEKGVPDIYAFYLSTNPVLNKKILFLLKNHSACFDVLDVESNIATSVSISDKSVPIDHLDCIFLSKGYLTIRLNSELMEEPLNTDLVCLDETKLKTSCNIVYQYNRQITLCYISKSTDSDEDHKPSPVYIMIKENDCYVPKIMKYHRAAMCNIEDTGITVKIVDFDEIGQIENAESQSSVSAKIQPSTMGYFALFVIAVTLVKSFIFLTRGKKTRRDKEFV